MNIYIYINIYIFAAVSTRNGDRIVVHNKGIQQRFNSNRIVLYNDVQLQVMVPVDNRDGLNCTRMIKYVKKALQI